MASVFVPVLVVVLVPIAHEPMGTESAERQGGCAKVDADGDPDTRWHLLMGSVPS